MPTLPPAARAIVIASPVPAVPQTERPPEFVLGFAFLKMQMGALMGDAVELEHGNPDNCDTQQLTTTGLAYWRCTTNLMTFAASPDGLVHWAWVPPGLLEWTGDADPPPDAPIISQTGAGAGGQTATACLAAEQVPSLTCNVADSVSALATIAAPGDTHTFHFSVATSGAEVIADLSDLPADYDLYLADASGTILAASLEEGTTPEHVDINVGGGTFYLYVHSDAGRPVDPQNPYHLALSLATPSTGASASIP